MTCDSCQAFTTPSMNAVKARLECHADCKELLSTRNACKLSFLRMTLDVYKSGPRSTSTVGTSNSAFFSCSTPTGNNLCMLPSSYGLQFAAQAPANHLTDSTMESQAWCSSIPTFGTFSQRHLPPHFEIIVGKLAAEMEKVAAESSYGSGSEAKVVSLFHEMLHGHNVLALFKLHEHGLLAFQPSTCSKASLS